ncbi:MAG: adenylate/guanylate cyclase domain-containing protein [Terrimicrobiaceae bacterium]|nr:adenylate/guanylate cyclase domain-containing protein [Terrimicrobiaceae bacterium]
MAADPARRTLPVFVRWAVLALICTTWFAASQIRFLPGGGFTGLDGLLGFLEEPTIDARLLFRGSIAAKAPLVYVDIDTASIQTLGNFPWNREVFAELLDALFVKGNARAVGMDLVFSEAGLPQQADSASTQGSLALGKAIRAHQAVVLAATYGTQTGVLGRKSSFPFLYEKGFKEDEADLPELPAFPVIGPTWGHTGLIDTLKESVRCIPLFAPTAHKTYRTMALELALLWWGLDGAAVEIGRDRAVIQRDGEVLATIPLHVQQFVEPNWFSPWISTENPRAGVADVLAYAELASVGSLDEQAEAAKFFESFRDAVVLIGATDPLLRDVSLIPMNGSVAVPRVSLHGNLFKTIVSNAFPIRPPPWLIALITLVIGLSTAGVATRLGGWGAVASVSAILVGYIAAAFLAFRFSTVLLPIVAPAGAALSCTFLAVIHQLGVEQQSRRRIKQLFGTYVSSDVVDEMVDRHIPPQTGGVEVDITAFFSDVEAFTPLSESLPPADLVELMCEYFGEGTAAIMDSAGTLDKYVGDAMVAMFGAPLPCPDHAAAACRAALAVQDAQARLRLRWSEEGSRWPERVRQMRTRIGLHTGPAIVGNLGSSRRFNYTMMGATVNLAQRMEATVAHYEVSILVTSATQSAATKHDPGLVFRSLDCVVVPGTTEPVEIFELLGRGPELQTRIEAFASARSRYLAGDWTGAAAAFDAAAALEPNATRNPAVVLAKRCRIYAQRGEPAGSIFRLTKA